MEIFICGGSGLSGFQGSRHVYILHKFYLRYPLSEKKHDNFESKKKTTTFDDNFGNNNDKFSVSEKKKLSCLDSFLKCSHIFSRPSIFIL